MEILQLKYFLDSAKNESFTKTATKYMVPTTSVSASVKRLEKELGCKLFDRESNRIRLNAKGKIFLNSLHKVFAELELAQEELAASDDDTREIKILARAIRSDITESIIKFKKKHPDVIFRLSLDTTPKSIDDYDIIIDEKSEKYLDFDSFELYCAPLYFFADAGNPLCKRKLRLDELETYPFVSWGENSNTHRILMDACKKVGFVPNICVSANDIKCYERFIESGIGIGLARMDSSLSGNSSVRALDIKDFAPLYTVCCYYKRHSAYGNVRMFLSLLENSKE